MTIERLCVQIDRRLAEARDEIQRLEAARDALGKGADTVATLAPVTRRNRPPQTRRRARRVPRGTTRQAVLSALVHGQAMTARELAGTTGLRRETIAPELSKLVKTGELIKAERGYKTPSTDGARTTPPSSAAGRSGAKWSEKSPAAVALGRELDAGLRTRV
jgi:hypothetical protein